MPDSKLSNNKIYDYIKLWLKGCCIGIANIIPGVSGGTVAFVFGIYEDLVKAIKSFDITCLKLLFTFKIKALFNHIPWRFLAVVFFGVFTAILSVSRGLSWLLQNKPVLVYAFFFGLILATGPVIAKRVRKWNVPTGIALLLATVGTFFFVGLVPVTTPDTLWFLFLSGMIAAVSMILPGLSGAFMLVLIGKYQYILDAINDGDIVSLGVVAFGCAVGVLVFVRGIHWLLTHKHDVTVAFLTGLVLGSLRKIWPWKVTLESITSSKGKIIPIEQVNILPPQINAETIYAVILCAIGFYVAIKLSTPTPKQITEE
ncbi:MAG: DUF368 domain-containing protein [Candidatus Ancaeobacter aquaticus]|nr:DUF368 domain-containing protein [Candidatus Ancaeobacter aquaticus]